jgi:hypothetical protein
MTDKEILYINAGKIVVFSSGAYSDYSLHGMFVGLQDVTFEQAKEVVAEVQAAAELIEDDGGYCSHCDKAMMYQGSLISRGYLMEVDYIERWVGSYGDLEVHAGY